MKVFNLETFLFALLLTTIAGLSTTIGSLTAFIIKEPSKKFISIIMGFSAGVMILISFVELLQKGIKSTSFLIGNIFFLIGMVLMFLIDVIISHKYEFEEQARFSDKNMEKTFIISNFRDFYS